MHVEQQEPAEVSDSLPRTIVEQLRALGHDIKTVRSVGGYANTCERLSGGSLRGASNVWAVGVS